MSRRFPSPDRLPRPAPRRLPDPFPLVHDWVRESADTRVHRCLVCGARCNEPAEVTVSCAELMDLSHTGRGKKRHQSAGAITWRRS